MSKKKNTTPQVSFIEDCYRLYEQKMYRVAYRVLNDEGQAEDAVSEAFIRLMKKDVFFEDAKSDDCKRYIIKVIKNVSINIYNKNKNFLFKQIFKSVHIILPFMGKYYTINIHIVII